jgi:hypothetical protein
MKILRLILSCLIILVTFVLGVSLFMGALIGGVVGMQWFTNHCPGWLDITLLWTFRALCAVMFLSISMWGGIKLMNQKSLNPLSLWKA